ncbi:MAG: hypothetical protein MPN21_09745 [Thermoanaerobaculia bacterium]|nr:hypothetical protein [Thermoanaerobaculia bacterium]
MSEADPSTVALEEADVTAGGPDLLPHQADAEALAEVYRQGVDTSSASPGIGEYFRDTIIYGLGRLFDWLGEKWGAFSWLNWDLVQTVLSAVLLALVGWLLFVLLRRFLARRGEQQNDGRVLVDSPRRPTTASHDWAEELRLRLERGDVAAALEALWWWLAAQVGVPNADPSWTSRELLIHAGRGDLRRPVRSLDHMIYGPVPPRAVEVGELWQRLQPLVVPGSVDSPGAGADSGAAS